MTLLLQCLRDARVRAGESEMLPPLPAADAVMSQPSASAGAKPGVAPTVEDPARAARSARAAAAMGGEDGSMAAGMRSELRQRA